MLGERVVDQSGVESPAGSVEAGLHLLPVETSFAALDEKVTQLSIARLQSSAARGLFAHLTSLPLQVFQIHVGRTAIVDLQAANDALFTLDTGSSAALDGCLNADGWCAGCYLHGLFENDAMRHALIAALAERRSLFWNTVDLPTFQRQREYDKLADVLRSSLNLEHLKEVCGL
jgi:adenosylcobyric acid synthase